MPTEQKKVLVFDASLQADTEHTVDIDANGEIVLTSTDTGHFLKFPAGTTAVQLKEAIAAHKLANTGQKSIEAMEKEKAALLEGLG